MSNIDNISNPTHVAIIMDGNGRWAKKKGLPRIAGHKEGVNKVKEIIETSIELNLKFLTLFAFSSDNWRRPKSEVKDLMSLLNNYLDNEIEEYLKRNVRLRVIGSRERLHNKIVKKINKIEIITKKNNGLQLTIALDYSGREDILFAMKETFKRNVKDKHDIDEIDCKLFSQNLMTYELPDPDLIIRTSGEIRLSNFFLWQSAYSEFDFVECYWPDFNKEHFIACVKKYQNRERRYGNINE